MPALPSSTYCCQLAPRVFALARLKLSSSVNTGSGNPAVIESESEAVLLPGTGSEIPAGAVTLTVLVSVPVAVGETVALTVNVTVRLLLLAPRLMLRLMFPVPLVLPPQVAEPGALQVHDTFVNDAGITSLTAAPATALGPLFVTMIVYVTGPPAATLVTLSVMVTERSAGCVAGAAISSAPMSTGATRFSPS